MKIDWARKLTSRKFWAAIVGFVVPLIIASGGTAEFATEVTAIIMAALKPKLADEADTGEEELDIEIDF